MGHLIESIGHPEKVNYTEIDDYVSDLERNLEIAQNLAKSFGRCPEEAKWKT